MNELNAIADAVVTELAGHQFAQAFTPTRQTLPGFDLPELGDQLRVVVIPRSDQETFDSRTNTSVVWIVDVVALQKVDPGVEAQIDVVTALIREIADFMRFRRPAGLAFGSTWIGGVIEPHIDEKVLREWSVAMTRLQLRYRGFRHAA